MHSNRLHYFLYTILLLNVFLLFKVFNIVWFTDKDMILKISYILFILITFVLLSYGEVMGIKRFLVLHNSEAFIVKKYTIIKKTLTLMYYTLILFFLIVKNIDANYVGLYLGIFPLVFAKFLLMDDIILIRNGLGLAVCCINQYGEKYALVNLDIVASPDTKKIELIKIIITNRDDTNGEIIISTTMLNNLQWVQNLNKFIK